MQYYHRNLMEEIKKWIDRREILAIRGPRQSGKTTLLKMIEEYLTEVKNIGQEKVIYVVFEDRDILESFSRDPKRFVQSYIGQDKDSRYFFLIDEFQYLEDGGQKLKLLYDILENVKFIISGSSSLELTSSTAKYLVGRVFLFDLLQFSFSEFLETKEKNIFNLKEENEVMLWKFLLEGVDIDIKEELFEKEFIAYFEEYLRYGGYPEVIKTNDPETKQIVLKNIYETYLTRDIVELLQIEDITKFRTIIALLSNNIGNLLNYNSLALDGQSYFKQIKHYLSVLEETFIIKAVSPYYSSMITELKKNPKVYFVDLGLRNFIIRNFNSLELRPDSGNLAENFVLTELSRGGNNSVKYWRTTGKAEVDFIVDNSKTIIPVEVKYSRMKSPEVSRGFRSYISQYKPERAVVLTKGFWGKMKIGVTNIMFIPIWYI